MRITIVTDAWTPQVNGVVRTLRSVRDEIVAAGHDVTIVSPDQFYSIACPTYPEIRLALALSSAVGRRIGASVPDAIHIATEGPLGWAARRWCLRRGFPFTTAYHTQFPDYVAGRSPVPAEWVWRYIRRFHAPASAVLASTPSIRRTLQAHGIANVRAWGRGVDQRLFRAGVAPHPAYASLARPIQLYVGRVAVEKNIAAFLDTTVPGSKVVVGGGPLLDRLTIDHPDIAFLGMLSGEALAAAYAGADVLVFPSVTDTFGLVMIEALACGVPVAAFPVTGPIDVLVPEVSCLDDHLGRAIEGALTRDRAACAAFGAGFTWAESARQFVEALAPIDRGVAIAA